MSDYIQEKVEELEKTFFRATPEEDWGYIDISDEEVEEFCRELQSFLSQSLQEMEERGKEDLREKIYKIAGGGTYISKDSVLSLLSEENHGTENPVPSKTCDCHCHDSRHNARCDGCKQLTKGCSHCHPPKKEDSDE